MGHIFPKLHLQRVYQYIKLHDGETILKKDIAKNAKVGKNTVTRDVRWLLKRGIVRCEGKTFSIVS